MKNFENRNLQKKYEQIKSGERDASSAKKRKRSHVFIFIDAVIIIMILMFFYNSTPDNIFQTTTLEVDDIEYRFTVSSKNKDPEINFSLSLESKSGSKKEVKFNNQVAKITIFTSGNKILEKDISKKTRSLILESSESRTFVTSLNKGAFLSKYNELNLKSNGSIFSLMKRTIPVKVKIDILSKSKPSTELNFKYEASK